MTWLRSNSTIKLIGFMRVTIIGEAKRPRSKDTAIPPPPHNITHQATELVDWICHLRYLGRNEVRFSSLPVLASNDFKQCGLYMGG